MSINQLIQDCLKDGGLFQVFPRLPSSPVNRVIYANSNVNELVVGPWSDKAHEIRCGRLWADFDRFIEGRLISVALNNPYKHPKSTYLSRLDPVSDEVWEIRSRDPKPSLRVFGMFAKLDCLILFDWGERKAMGGPGSRQFRDAMNRCKAEWRNRFPAHNPHSGRTVNDYVSGPTLSV